MVLYLCWCYMCIGVVCFVGAMSVVVLRVCWCCTCTGVISNGTLFLLISGARVRVISVLCCKCVGVMCMFYCEYVAVMCMLYCKCVGVKWLLCCERVGVISVILS